MKPPNLQRHGSSTTPVTKQLTVADRQPTELVLYDLVGRPVHQTVLPAGQRSITIDPGLLSNGVYMMRLGSGTSASTKKLVVRH